MDQSNSTLIPSVIVKNDFPKRIKVKVDSLKNFVKLVRANSSRNTRAPKGSVLSLDSKNCEYIVFNYISAGDQFIIMNPFEVKVFALEGRKEKYAFLTIWIENEDGSWSVYCENHPIIRHSEISVGLKSFTTPFLFIRELFGSGFMSLKEPGSINVSNNSSKKIWIKIDADDIQEDKRTLFRSSKPSGRSSSVSAISSYAVKNLVYYRVQQGRGFTQISKGEKINFYLNILKNRISISINYETSSGELARYNANHPLEFQTRNARCPFRIIIRDSEGEITFDTFPATV